MKEKTWFRIWTSDRWKGEKNQVGQRKMRIKKWWMMGESFSLARNKILSYEKKNNNWESWKTFLTSKNELGWEIFDDPWRVSTCLSLSLSLPHSGALSSLMRCSLSLVALPNSDSHGSLFVTLNFTFPLFQDKHLVREKKNKRWGSRKGEREK